MCFIFFLGSYHIESDLMRIWSSYSRMKKHRQFYATDLQFGAVADISMAKK